MASWLSRWQYSPCGFAIKPSMPRREIKQRIEPQLTGLRRGVPLDESNNRCRRQVDSIKINQSE